MSEPEPSRPGAVLRAEREALGVTVREVSETLNLSIAVVEAIEADDYQRLPGPVFARGYLRAYARLLELDPEPLVAQYPRPPEPLPVDRVRPEAPVWEWIRLRPELVLGSAGAVLVLLLALLVLWLWPDGQESEPAGGDDSAAVEFGGAALAEEFSVDPAAAGALTPWGPASAPRSGRSEAQRAAEAVAAGPFPTPFADSGNVHRITDRGNDRLEFTFSEDCWVEVRSATGARLYSDLSRGGSELVLVGEGPFRILLGYAPGAELSFNGEHLPLAPHTRNNVATLVLGH